MSDLINRKEAIAYAISGRVRTFPTSEDGENWIKTEEVRQSLLTMPSAEPEPLTDREQRIFLAAMGREEKVCKQVDDEWRNCMEPYEDSLVRTCHEIIRKVKSALWT